MNRLPSLAPRTAASRIARTAATEHALQNSFREANLNALRDLALRRLAEQVNVDIQIAWLGGASRK